ncbi:hypothetical protein RIF23_13105 [Lipingzhangella sp. LS1_29]|uniref:Small multi-drug export protein n=1 Tax=Lipingzhangella rawalii TaxID=2055835 RepID=A0ABU2H9F7_9ACTN|nr:hypothetical protein [Lipingzhangella rawalii]MDS1271234.1 hypothetical protein [Lipingzhangella rawalii]
MTATDLVLLLGVFLGGAAPWLEAVIVIPAGILAGLNPIATVIAGTVGNLLTVAVAAWFGDRIRVWWRRRRSRRRQPAQPVQPMRPVQSAPSGVGNAGDDCGTDATDDAENGAAERSSSGSWQRAQRIAQRWGVPALAALGPIGLGTQLSALVGISLGLSARKSFLWIGTATVLWAIVAAWATLAGVSIAGVGA